jgi:hypothetical protein
VYSPSNDLQLIAASSIQSSSDYIPYLPITISKYLLRYTLLFITNYHLTMAGYARRYIQVTRTLQSSGARSTRVSQPKSDAGRHRNWTSKKPHRRCPTQNCSLLRLHPCTFAREQQPVADAVSFSCVSAISVNAVVCVETLPFVAHSLFKRDLTIGRREQGVSVELS